MIDQLIKRKINEVKPRSVFFGIEPIGLGTSYVESLSSYISRLAIYHNVPITILLNETIGPRLESTYLTDKFAKRLAPNRYYLINGISSINREFINVLEKLTGRNDIEHLTFKNWEGIFSKNIVVKHKRWCPVCLEEWRKESKPVYEPLIWLVSDIEKCEIHYSRLKEHCHNCGKKLAFIHRHSLVGHCQYCYQWLGESESSNKKEYLSKEELFLIEYYKKLLESGSKQTSFPSKSFICLVLPQIKESLKIGRVLDFAQFLDVRYHKLIDWMKNRHIPSPEALVSICQKLDCTIDELLSLSMENDILNHKCITDQGVLRKKVTKEKVYSSLLNEIKKDKPRSLGQICNELGVTSKYVYWNYPILGKKISDKYLSFKNQQDIQVHNKIKEVLEKSLKKDEPESLIKCLDDNDISYKIAKRHHPTLCQEISTRFSNYISENKRKRLEQTQSQILKVIYELNEEGIYPSVAKITQRNPGIDPNIFRQKVFNDFRKTTAIELGYELSKRR
ncbi:TniQ family protein [Mesobacillus jeotgali]|uniref:TniQ family protein n=1 Tax=Mesobacillus jeotgali TaxID=129985 RepID=A0ABY9VIQ1_9BACI|nr:TniQ family protein [Mesobacillus jeotgali]WNF22480.1 TniQ family protein [Mesobacillus jeotgali]